MQQFRPSHKTRSEQKDLVITKLRVELDRERRARKLLEKRLAEVLKTPRHLVLPTEKQS